MQSRATKVVNIIDRIISRIIIIFFAAILCICLYAVYDVVSLRNETNVIAGASKIIENTPDDERIAELRKVNSDIIAWITIDNADIDFPITQTTNNNFYLNHDYKKEYSIAGNIFADYRSDLLADDYAVIYGHNMNGDQMFGALHKFEDAGYFSGHSTGRIYLSDGSQHELSILNFAIIMNDSEYAYNIDTNANNTNAEIISYIGSLSINKNVPDKYPNTLLLLSTCYKHSRQRAVLLVGYDR